MPNALSLYGQIQHFIHQGGSVAGQMAKLLAEFEPLLPAKELNALRSLDYESELSALTARLQSGIDAAPPPKAPGGIYFGLFLPGRADGSIVADFYLATTDENDPADAECHWVSSLDYFPSDAQAQSEVLERICRLLPGMPEDVRNTAEDVLCLGYTGFVVAQVLNAPCFRAWCEDGRVIPVAVGWDSGDLLRIGELTAEGLRAPEPAKKPKRRAKGSGLDHIAKLGGVVHFVPPPYEPPPASPRVELYPVVVNSCYGFINPEGELVIEPKVWNARDFSEGLAAVWLGAGWGFLNAAGEIVIEPQFRECGDFHGGLASVGGGYIDPSGALVIPWQHDAGALLAPGFSCGRVVLRKFKTDVDWTCLDGQGRELFSGATYIPRGYSDGLLIADYWEPGTVLWDLAGRRVMDFPAYQRGRGFDWIGDFSEGLAALCLGKHGCGYMDRTGRIRFRLRRGEHGINSKFSEGRAAFELDGKLGFVDREGNEVVEPQFELVEPFSNGLVSVSDEGKYGFINLDGVMQIPCRFDFSLSGGFRGSLARVVEKGRVKLINQAGETVWHGPPWSP